MKTQFTNKLLCQPWDISRERGRTLIASMLERLKAERPAEDRHGNPLPKLYTVGDVAVIPIAGALMVNVPDWVKSYGLGITDADDIEIELHQAQNDPRISMIVLDFDSPGGWSI